MGVHSKLIAPWLAVSAGLLLAGCGGSQPSQAAWASSPGSVHVVVQPSVLHKPADFRATVFNRSGQTISWGGCVYSDRWPSHAKPQAYCITGAVMRPHASLHLSESDFASGRTPSRPGLYRMIFAYQFGTPFGSNVQLAYAPFTIAKG